MTEYELLNAIQGQVSIVLTDLTNMISIMTAYLVVGYFAAHRISWAMALFVTGLFLLWSLVTLGLAVGSLNLLLSLTDEMRAQAQAGHGFQWWPEFKASSGFAGRIGTYLSLGVMCLASLGSVYFFFECRTRNMKAEAAPKDEPPAAPAA
jgi:hypothetical protein